MRKLFLLLTFLLAADIVAAKHYSFQGGYPVENARRLPAAAAEGVTLEGKVTWVSDGDTIWVTPANGRRVKVRLYGIDAPEKNQPWGAESKTALIRKVQGRKVVVKATERDVYDRLVGRVLLDGEDVNGWMISEGHAWWYRYYAGDETAWGELEKAARAGRKGLWSQPNPVNPYVWRKTNR